jgi:hypothetical protein
MEKHEFVLARNSLILRIRNTAGLVNSLAEERNQTTSSVAITCLKKYTVACLKKYTVEGISFYCDTPASEYEHQLATLEYHLKTLQRISRERQNARVVYYSSANTTEQ